MFTTNETIFKYSQLGIAFLGLDGEWISVNDALCQIFGYSSEELLSRPLTELFLSDEANEPLKLALLHRSERYYTECGCSGKDGEPIWVSFMFSLVHGEAEQPGCYIMQVKEITDRVTMKQELEENKERYRSLYAYNQNGIITCTRTGIIEDLNPAAEAITGYASTELVNRPIQVLFPGNAQSRDYLHRCKEIHLLKKDQSFTEVEIQYVPIVVRNQAMGYYLLLKHLSETKKLLEELRQARQELQETLQYQQGMTFKFKQSDGRFIHTLCEGELKHKLGFSSDQVVGRELKDFLPEDKAIRKEAYYRSAWNGDPNVTYEGQQNGTTYLASLKPIVKNGKVVEVIASCVDITDRKKAETARIEAEALYRNLIEHSPVGVFLLQDARLQYVNPYLAALFGYSPREFVSQNLTDLLDKHDLDRFQKKLAKIDEHNPQFVYTIKGRKQDAARFELEGNCTLIQHHGKSAVMGVVRDVTDKLQVTQMMKDTATRYKKLVKFLPESVVVHEDGIILYANRSTVKLVKAGNENQLTGKSVYDFLQPEVHEDTKRLLHQLLLTDEATEFRERKLRCLTGDTVDVEISSIQIYNDYGHPVILSVMRDLTERKEAEELIVQSEKLAVVGQLAAGVAHEIRNPLTALKGFAQLLRKQSDNLMYLDIMQQELDRINLIVNDFVALAKPQEQHFAQKNMKEIIQSVLSILGTQAILNKVEIIEIDQDELPLVVCDENQLKQVFMNLLKNAIEAMPQGGQVTIRTGRRSDCIYIQIQDNGIGIPAAVLRRIGEPFFTTKEKGTGLGLMICRRIIESHRGKIKITSQKEKGTNVDIRLPLDFSR